MHNVENDGYTKIARVSLWLRMKAELPDNTHRYSGYALINVLDPNTFSREHIAGSINIPREQEDGIEERFSKRKEIVVYGASRQCPAAAAVAQELVRRGFVNVFHYEDGMSEWKNGSPINWNFEAEAA